MKTKILLAFMILATATMSCKRSNIKKEGELELPATQLMIVNETDSAVTVWITLGATDGCLQQVSDIPYITDTLSNLVGYFILEAHDSTQAYAPLAQGFNGNITFNTQPLNCPDSLFPNGVNLFEFIINNSFQPGTPQETVDISCVAGVNSAIKAYLSGGANWNASSTYPDVDSLYNVGLVGNSGLVGVYPYGCDTCTGAKMPPKCVTSSSDKQTQSICNVQRDAIGSGGIVKVVYLGSK